MEQRLGIVRLGRVPLEVFRFGESLLQVLAQRLGEVAAANRHAALPNPEAVGDDQVGRVRAHRQHQRRRRRAVGIVLVVGRQILQLVEGHEVVQRQRRQLHDIDFDARGVEWFQRSRHLLALHGEQADLGFQGEPFFFAAARHALVVPNDVVQVKRDLLPRFIFDDVGNFLRFDRRQLDKPRQPVLTGRRNRNAVAFDLVARKKLLQRLGNQLGRFGLGLAEDFGVFDIIERIGRNAARFFAANTTQGFDAALANVNAPHTLILRHE